MCGGFPPGSNSFQIRLQNKKCFMLDMWRNQWKSLPNLPEGVSYATANFLEGQLMVLGGFRERQKVSYTQVKTLPFPNYFLQLFFLCPTDSRPSEYEMEARTNFLPFWCLGPLCCNDFQG